MMHHDDLLGIIDIQSMAVSMAREAIDRSRGQLEELCVEDFGSDELLRYLADRTSHLRVLRLISCYDMTDEVWVELAPRFPLLEELEFSHCSFTEDTYKSIGRACPHLRSFRLNARCYIHIRPHLEYDEEAVAIANNMPGLHQLQLFGNKLTNEGLVAILNNCPHLQFLDIRQCFNVNMDRSLRAKCARIKDVRLPNDPTDDYPFDADNVVDEIQQFPLWIFRE